MQKSDTGDSKSTPFDIYCKKIQKYILQEFDLDFNFKQKKNALFKARICKTYVIQKV